MASPKFHNSFRQYHRWLGFFLAGIMFIYSLSGVLLIFRKTDFLKYDQTSVQKLEPGLNGERLAEQLRLSNFRVNSETAAEIQFPEGSYNKASGEVTVTRKDYPLVLAKLVKLHKATTNSPLYFLNIFFGLGLLFFVISSILMFMPKMPLFKSHMKIVATGAVFAIIVVIFGS